jgi:hypothetical protein
MGLAPSGEARKKAAAKLPPGIALLIVGQHRCVNAKTLHTQGDEARLTRFSG